MGKLDLRDMEYKNTTNEFWYAILNGRIYSSHGRCGWSRKCDLISSIKLSDWYRLWKINETSKYNRMFPNGADDYPLNQYLIDQFEELQYSGYLQFQKIGSLWKDGQGSNS